MGYNARNDEICDNLSSMRARWEAEREALATVRRFNASLFAKGYAWFWPKIAAALIASIGRKSPQKAAAPSYFYLRNA